jgi:hypothetical protein
VNDEFVVYPNIRSHVIAQEPRGYLRAGLVAENEETRSMYIAGYKAAGQKAVVTQESDGWCRFYIWTKPHAEDLFPDVMIWVGPFSSISEDIESKGETENG